MDEWQAVLGLLIIVVAMISFILEKIPIAITAVGASLLMVAIGALSFEDSYVKFGSTATVFTACMMVVGSALFNTGVIDLVVKWFQRSRVERSPRLLVAAITLVTACLSAFLSNSAVVAIFLPLIGILAARATTKLNVQLLAISAGIGAAIGGIATLTGSTAQLVTQDILMETEGARPMSMFTLSAVGGPLIIITVVYMATLGYRIGTRVLADRGPVDLVGLDSTELPDSEERGHSAKSRTSSSRSDGSRTGDSAGPGVSTAVVDHTPPKASLNWRMPFSLVVLILMIVGFSIGIADIATVAMVGAIVLIVTGCLPFTEALKRIDWNTIIILSAAQAFGAGLTQSGGGQLVADWITSLLGGISGEWLILLFLCMAAMVLTNFASNVALTAMFVPIGMSVAASVGADPTSWAIAITLACNIAVFTPIGTPCMTQTLVAKLRYTDYIKIGLPLAVILTIATAFLSLVVYP
ncbi:SLC13 family permease [Brevibacterium sp. FME17]|uniref:SLC13 family permease n=1 Tax=Brevibacterium sp. FME17 TaxID=2742606 RepID=UPI001868649B|nr:SLC13 family permease [Brevibacterium sp. FME17]